MKTDPRVTPEQTIAAYYKTGLRPIRELYIDQNETGLCGCPLGALYLAKHPKDRRLEVDLIYFNADTWADNLYGIEYALAFTAAFDRGVGNLEESCPYSDSRAADGWSDGRAVCFAVHAEFWSESR